MNHFLSQFTSHIIKQIPFPLYKSFYEIALKLEKVIFYIHYSPQLLDMIVMIFDWGEKQNRTQVLFNVQWLAAQEYSRDYLKGGQLSRVTPAALSI